MFDDLSQVERRYEELAYRMTTPEAMNDPAAYAAMMREYKELTPWWKHTAAIPPCKRSGRRKSAAGCPHGGCCL